MSIAAIAIVTNSLSAYLWPCCSWQWYNPITGSPPIFKMAALICSRDWSAETGHTVHDACPHLSYSNSPCYTSRSVFAVHTWPCVQLFSRESGAFLFRAFSQWFSFKWFVFCAFKRFFSSDFLSRASLCATVALASPTQFVPCSRDRVFSHSRVISFLIAYKNFGPSSYLAAAQYWSCSG